MALITDPPKPPRFWHRGLDKQLGPTERELLRAAAESNGRIVILRKNDGEWVRIGAKDHGDTAEDPGRRQKALDARARLIELGCLACEGDGAKLTPRGSAIAARLGVQQLARQ